MTILEFTGLGGGHFDEVLTPLLQFVATSGALE
jgi:hypothetical protein